LGVHFLVITFHRLETESIVDDVFSFLNESVTDTVELVKGE